MTEHSQLHTNFGTTLRTLADTEPDLERARKMILLAAQLEVAFDQQGSTVQVAIWDVQEATRLKIDDLHAHQADTNVLLSGVMEAIGGLRTDVQHSASEVAARLGKLDKDLRGLNKRHGAQIKALGADIAAIKAVMAARPAQRDAERAAYEKRLSAMERRLEALEAARGDG